MNSIVKYAMMALALTPAALAQTTTQNTAYQTLAPGADNDVVVRISLVQPGPQNNLAVVRPQLTNMPGMAMASNQQQEPRQQEAPAQASVPQQSTNPQQAPAPILQPAQAPASKPEIVLRDGMPVRLRLTRTLSSANVKTGDQIDFDVLDDIRVAGQVIIPRSSKAIGVITEAEHKKWAARGGKLNLALQYVRLDDGTKVNLRAESDNKGGGHVAAMTTGMVASVALSFGVAAPLLLFIHGKEAIVPAGTELTAFVDGDTRLSPALQAYR